MYSFTGAAESERESLKPCTYLFRLKTPEMPRGKHLFEKVRERVSFFYCCFCSSFDCCCRVLLLVAFIFETNTVVTRMSPLKSMFCNNKINNIRASERAREADKKNQNRISHCIASSTHSYAQNKTPSFQNPTIANNLRKHTHSLTHTHSDTKRDTENKKKMNVRC